MRRDLAAFLERERQRLAAFERAWERKWTRDTWAKSASGAEPPVAEFTDAEWRAQYEAWLRDRERY